MNDPTLAFGVGVAMGTLFALLVVWPAVRWRRDDSNED